MAWGVNETLHVIRIPWGFGQAFNMNQSDSQKIEQKRCTCQPDFTFSPPNSHYKRFKFELILNKSVRLQFHEEVKDIILESLCLTVALKKSWFIIWPAALQSSLSIEEKIICLKNRDGKNFDQNFI